MQTRAHATATVLTDARVLAAGCSSGSSTSSPLATSASSHSSSESSTTPNSQAPSGSGTSSIPAPKPVTGRPATITIGASGDLIAHASTVAQARAAAGGRGYAFAPFFAALKPTVGAPTISICQMENPLSRTNTDLSVEYSFNAPREFATATRSMGFDGCSTANNHTWDRGQKGMEETREVLATNHLKASGPGTKAGEKGQPVFYEANGLKVAQLSHNYSLINAVGDRWSVPKEAPRLKDAMWFTRTSKGVVKDAAAARAQGADLVLVSMHWGYEYEGVNAQQKQVTAELMRSGQVDWIIGNHPHVVQPCDKVNGRYVTYSLGNFFSGQIAAIKPGTAERAFAAVTFERDAAGKWKRSMTFQPTYQNQTTRHVELASPTSNADSYRKTVRTMGLMGCDAKPAS